MKKNQRNAALLTAILANAPCIGTAQEDFAPDPIVQLAGGLLVFNRHCADREPYIVQAYALMDSGDGRARALVYTMRLFLVKKRWANSRPMRHSKPIR